MIIYDHTHPAWRVRYERHGRTNGAFTYSQDICRWHLPIWGELLGKDQSVATCGIVPGATVQYLHERTQLSLSPETRLFVTTYKDLADALGKRGLWMPNTIDADILPVHRPVKDWVYYGNLIGAKQKPIERLKKIRFDLVSGVSSQSEALRRVSQYRYGIGVGRCALEMMAMGLKVLIFGKDLGGLILTPDDFERQREANFNANVITGVGGLDEAIARIDDAQTPVCTFQAGADEIRSRIIEGWRRAC